MVQLKEKVAFFKDGKLTVGEVDFQVQDEFRVRYDNTWTWVRETQLMPCDARGNPMENEFIVKVMVEPSASRTPSMGLDSNGQRNLSVPLESTVGELRKRLTTELFAKEGYEPEQIFVLNGKKILGDGDKVPKVTLSIIVGQDLSLAKQALALPAKDLARYIDHTVLAADTRLEKVETLCNEAKQFGFFSVCVNSSYAADCARLLKGSSVAVCSVVGFPLGAGTSQSKADETRSAIQAGAKEIDMVINVGRAKNGDWDYVQKDISAVVQAANGVLVKVIFETCLLTNDEIVKACKASVAAGAQFVKTSTGFSKAGARLDHIALMRANVTKQMGVKASGGIRTAGDCRAYIACGATRIGASKGVQIAQDKTAPAGGSY